MLALEARAWGTDRFNEADQPVADAHDKRPRRPRRLPAFNLTS
jgi:hypothetical protein